MEADDLRRRLAGLGAERLAGELVSLTAAMAEGWNPGLVARSVTKPGKEGWAKDLKPKD